MEGGRRGPRITRITRLKTGGLLAYPCDPCHPWFSSSPSSFILHPLLGEVGRARHALGSPGYSADRRGGVAAGHDLSRGRGGAAEEPAAPARRGGAPAAAAACHRP